MRLRVRAQRDLTLLCQVMSTFESGQHTRGGETAGGECTALQKNSNLTKSLTQYFILPKHCCLFPYNNGKKSLFSRNIAFLLLPLSKFFQSVTVLKQRNDQITCLQSKQMRFVYSNQFMLNDQAKLCSFSLFTHRRTQMQMSGVKHDLEESHPLPALSPRSPDKDNGARSSSKEA